MEQTSSQAREASRFSASRVEEDHLEEGVRRYIVRLARRRSFHIQLDATPPLVAQELKARWPVEPGTEQQARDLQLQIKGLIKPLIESVHPWTRLRIIINASAHPEVKVPFPDAPAVYAAFDAAQGTVRSRIAGASEVPLDSWIETIPLGLTLICQPTAAAGDPQAQGLGQGGNLFAYSDKELNELEEWRLARNKGSVISMMPRVDQLASDMDEENQILLAEAELVEEAILRQRHAEKKWLSEKEEERQIENGQKKQRADSALHEREYAIALALAIAKAEEALAMVKKNQSLIQKNPDLSPELMALHSAETELASLLGGGSQLEPNAQIAPETSPAILSEAASEITGEPARTPAEQKQEAPREAKVSHKIVETPRGQTKETVSQVPAQSVSGKSAEDVAREKDIDNTLKRADAAVTALQGNAGASAIATPPSSPPVVAEERSTSPRAMQKRSQSRRAANVQMQPQVEGHAFEPMKKPPRVRAAPMQKPSSSPKPRVKAAQTQLRAQKKPQSPTTSRKDQQPAAMSQPKLPQAPVASIQEPGCEPNE